MKKAQIPQNEAQRLQALLDYKILDTTPEEAFDRLTEMASKICDVPIALVSLIDSDRQWFKSRIGLDASQTPREISFCGHAINGKDLFIINDSTKDERFSDNPLVTDYPFVRFYAGAPLITPDGQAIGTLCVIDKKPRELTEDQKKFLKTLSEQVIAQLELRKTLEVAKKNFEELQNVTKVVLSQKEELARSEKLATIGKIAAGIAHEINNPLAIISGKVNLAIDLIQEGAPKEDVLYMLQRVDKTTDRISKIIESLSTYTKDGMTQLKIVCNLNNIIEESIGSLNDKIQSQGIQLKKSLDIPMNVKGDPALLNQAISHIIRNAIDAVETSPDKKISVELTNDANSSVIRVSDHGPGIDEEILDNVMDPFFTTKDVDKGKGLGLSVAKNIISSHGGMVKIEKHRDPTVFTIYLPKAG